MNGNIYIGLGTNLGDRLQNLEEAYRHIATECGQILRKSSVYVSPPWGFEADLDFYNSVIELETFLAPMELISKLKEIEVLMGRIKSSNDTYESRIIDLDILDYQSKVLTEETLQLPHPKMHLRLFTLVPLVEIFPEWSHPYISVAASQLIWDLAESTEIKKLQCAND